MAADWPQWLLVGFIFFLSSLVQGAVGFAAGMVGVPLFLLCGFDLPQAVAFALISSMVSNFSGAWRLRNDFDWRLAVLPVTLRLIAQPIGVLMMFLASKEFEDFSSQIVGFTLLALLLVQRWWRIEPRDSLHPLWMWIACPLSGFLFGFCSMGGPPLVMWVMAHRWPAARMRAFLFFSFASGLLPQLLLLPLFFGSEILWSLAIGSLAIPVLLLGSQLGLQLGHHMPERQLRQLSVIVLAILGISAVLMPLIR